jgi:hypothetical protein
MCEQKVGKGCEKAQGNRTADLRLHRESHPERHHDRNIDQQEGLFTRTVSTEE